jgi:hypothetical protein
MVNIFFPLPYNFENTSCPYLIVFPTMCFFQSNVVGLRIQPCLVASATRVEEWMPPPTTFFDSKKNNNIWIQKWSVLSIGSKSIHDWVACRFVIVFRLLKSIFYTMKWHRVGEFLKIFMRKRGNYTLLFFSLSIQR